MTQFDFENLELVKGQRIWLMDEEGRGFFGYFENEYSSKDLTFMFQNSGNGQDEKINIIKLQRLEKRD
jgi:hypothetical protein